MATVTTTIVLGALLWVNPALNTGVVVKFDTMAECEAAKASVVRFYGDTWSPFAGRKADCIPVTSHSVEVK